MKFFCVNLSAESQDLNKRISLLSSTPPGEGAGGQVLSDSRSEMHSKTLLQAIKTYLKALVLRLLWPNVDCKSISDLAR